MKKTNSSTPERWAADWISSVARGSNKMSARKVTSIEKRGGGLKTVASLAKKQKVHLVMFADDQGCEVVAASTSRFKVLA